MTTLLTLNLRLRTNKDLTATLMKTVSYRLMSASVTAYLAYSATGSLTFASGFGLANLTVNSLLYFAFERVWSFFHNLPAPRTTLELATA